MAAVDDLFLLPVPILIT